MTSPPRLVVQLQYGDVAASPRYSSAICVRDNMPLSAVYLSVSSDGSVVEVGLNRIELVALHAALGELIGKAER